MARLLVQSRQTGKFLCPDSTGGSPVWVRNLAEAGGGVVADRELAWQLLEEWSDADDLAQIVDLDKLGTSNDYPL